MQIQNNTSAFAYPKEKTFAQLHKKFLVLIVSVLRIIDGIMQTTTFLAL